MTHVPDHVTQIIGLEIHVQLQTQSKLFCSCATGFGHPPNTSTCPVCIGMPGALPVVNRQAIQYSILAGLGLNSKIATVTHWDRKNYFYPDLPKGYQISQLDDPICGAGYLDFYLPKQPDTPQRVRINRAHLEEDAGKSIHGDHPEGKTKIDLNRAGTPLLEIVTEPDLRSPEAAKAFLTELKLTLVYLGVSDCNMQQGNLRVDANVNLHIAEEGTLFETPIVEIKNMNSFRAVERALQFEAERQLQSWNEERIELGVAAKTTRGWDDQRQCTVPQREKEDSADYRYFPDPDLQPLSIAPAEIAHLKSLLPELPGQLRKRLREDYRIPNYDAEVIVNLGEAWVAYFETLATQLGDGKLVSNWLTQDILRVVNDRQISIGEFPIPVSELAVLLKKQLNKELDQTRTRLVFDKMLEDQIGIDLAMKALGIRAVDENELAQIGDRVIQENQAIWGQILAGNTKAIGALIGAAKKIDSNVDPGKLRQFLLEKISS